MTFNIFEFRAALAERRLRLQELRKVAPMLIVQGPLYPVRVKGRSKKGRTS